MTFLRRIGSFLGCLCAVTAFSVSAAEPPSPSGVTRSESQLSLILPPPDGSVWQRGVGEGFRAATQTMGLDVGASYGLLILGSQERHELTSCGISYGHMLGGVKGANHWYRGNWEFRGELFGGAQFRPETRWVLGLTPHLRYSFATGTRWIPFVDIGAGVSTTDIREPDLGGPFQFNLQGGTGVGWLVKDNLAVSLEARYLHLSSARIYDPNLGVNTVIGLVALNWFF
jgi:lipid A 3-O-deacylase